MRPTDACKNSRDTRVQKYLHTKIKSSKEYTCHGGIFHKLKINKLDKEIIELVENSSSVVPTEIIQAQRRDKQQHMDFYSSTSRVIGRPDLVSGRNEKKQKREQRNWYSSLMSPDMIRNSGENGNLYRHNNNFGNIHQQKITKTDGGKGKNLNMRGALIEFHRGSSSRHDNPMSKHVGENAIKERENVKTILQKFRTLCDELLQENQAELKNNRKVNRRVDLQAAAILARQSIYTGKQYIGHVPGIEVGDKFYYRMEMRVVCLHHPPMAGIDSTFHAGKRVATSVVVASGYYDNNLVDPKVLIYCGQGGNSKITGRGKDQEWSYANVALKNSIDLKNPVRVIRNMTNTNEPVFVYQGLFQVVNYWEERGTNDKNTFKFKLIRLPGSN